MMVVMAAVIAIAMVTPMLMMMLVLSFPHDITQRVTRGQFYWEATVLGNKQWITRERVPRDITRRTNGNPNYKGSKLASYSAQKPLGARDFGAKF